MRQPSVKPTVIVPDAAPLIHLAADDALSVLDSMGRVVVPDIVELEASKVDVPLQIDHIVARSRGGSNRESNLTLACEPCNQDKGARPIEEFLAGRPAVLARVTATVRRPMKDAAAANATRWALINRLKTTGLPVETASGGRTKWNRSRFGIPKTHALDAACVGEVTALSGWDRRSLSIKATGRGAYCRTRVDKFGFPRGYLTRSKRIKNFQTGDIVQAVLTAGVHAGTWIGRVAVRATGKFNIQTDSGIRQGIGWKFCRVIQRADGYAYTSNKKASASSPFLKAGVSAPRLR